CCRLRPHSPFLSALRRAPSSTLFPYTTLFRSVADAELTLQLLDRLARFVRGDPEDVLIGQGLPLGVHALSLCRGVRTEDFQEQGSPLDLVQGRRHGRRIAVAFEVQKCDELPRAALGRPRFDLDQIDAPACERLQDAVEDTGL